MCGIFLQINSSNEPITCIDPHQLHLISNRGPDSFEEFTCDLGTSRIVGASSVLHLRGDRITKQPLQSTRFILQWNGEIFDYENFSDNAKLLEINDTKFLFDQLHLNENNIESVLTAIKGPWALALVDKKNRVVYFARDYFGRRSLLYSQQNNQFSISSVARNFFDSAIKWIEASSGVLYRFDIETNELTSQPMPLSKYIISPIDLEISLCDTEKEIIFTKEGLNQLRKSVRKRIISTHSNKFGILFSGGIDSVLIAAAAADIISKEMLEFEIDLINVAFEQSGLLKNLKLKEADLEYYESVPDRISGRVAYAELKKIFPTVKMNFITLNINRIQYEAAKDQVIELLQPNRTVMDLSLGIVLWFGSRGVLGNSKKNKVLLLGMGADEQLGGYSRHLFAFHSDGWKGLLAEMQMDLDRLGHRNLGRDDRCLSDNACEARFPFLDEDFVQWICDLPLRIKCDLILPKGQGDKRIFRLMVRSFGFSDSVVFRPKKAMQFGAKSAKISSNNCKGDDIL